MTTIKKFSKQFSLLLAAILTCGAMISSCTVDDNPAGPSPVEPTSSIDELVDNIDVKVISQDVITAEKLAEEAFGKNNLLTANPTLLELRRRYMKRQTEMTEKLTNGRANGLATGFVSCKFTYQSVDENGESIALSARVYWGVYWFFGQHVLDPDYIVLCPHFTIASNAECPTECHTYEAIALVGDNLLIMPDYEGYGASKDRTHPYINHHLLATQSYDALKAGYRVFRDYSGAKLEDDWKLYVAGCSQGGGNALAIHRELESAPATAKDWRFAYSYCCAGPYDPALTFNTYFEQKKHPYPVVFPLTIKSLLASFPDVLGKWKEDVFYSEDYINNLKPEIDRMISSKNYNADQINAAFFKKYPHTGEGGIDGGDEIMISDILNPALFDKNSEIRKAMFECLDRRELNLTKDLSLSAPWQHSHLIKLYHGKADDIVPYANSEAVVNTFPNYTEMFNSEWGTDGHISTCLKWLCTLAINNW